MTDDPCAGHACDACDWCTGALNNGIPVCCETRASSGGMPATRQRLDSATLRKAIATDQATQVSLSELIRTEVSVEQFRRLFSLVPNSRHVTPSLHESPSVPSVKRDLNPPVQSSLAAPSASIADLLIIQASQQRKKAP